MSPLGRDDRGLAGAVGVVLLLALAITLYANAVNTDVPRYGVEAERAWDADVLAVMRELGRSTGQGLEEGAPVSVLVPGPPAARAVEVPFVGRTAPVPPSGSVAFEPACAAFGATHTLANRSRVEDLGAGSNGCLVFLATPVYGGPFGYVMEFGGIVRLQGDRAYVIAGPPLEIHAAAPQEVRVTLGLPGLRGAAAASSTDGTPVRVDLLPGPSARETEQSVNARDVQWVLTTRHAEAWRAWFAWRLDQAGLVGARALPALGQSAADYMVACDPVDCSPGPDGRGRVIVRIEGPRVDNADLRLSISYGLFDVAVH